MIYPKTKAMATERKIPMTMVSAFSVLMRFTKDSVPVGSFTMRSIAMAKVAPRSSKTKETVVDVGNPSVLKKSIKNTSVIIEATKMHMISAKTKLAGWKTPCLATSIIPLLSKAPTKMPSPAIIKIIRTEAALLPTAELIKLTASLLTPTTKSKTANNVRKIINIR